MAADKIRDSCLIKLGYTVLRFNDYDVLTQTESVVDAISRDCSIRERFSLNPSFPRRDTKSSPIGK
jgi:very-short-patch-repair endonuclease